MTIKFYCPRCDALIAFGDKHCGKRARCTTCGQLFIIPSKDNETAQKIESEPEKTQPQVGFYRAVFLDSWKIFARRANATGLVFVAAAVAFKFFTGHTDYSCTVGMFRFHAPVGFVVTIAAWGCLFWYYMEIIYLTAFYDYDEELPEVDMGGFFRFVFNILKSVYLFVIALVVVELPCIITILILGKMQVELPSLTWILALCGVFFFPLSILTIAVRREINTLFRPSRILRPIVKAFCPYAVVAALFFLAWLLQFKTVDYGQLLNEEVHTVGLHLLANIGVQVIAVIAMHSTGLFYRHYRCYFPY